MVLKGFPNVPDYGAVLLLLYYYYYYDGIEKYNIANTVWCCLKKNLNASRPSEHLFPHRGKHVVKTLI